MSGAPPSAPPPTTRRSDKDVVGRLKERLTTPVSPHSPVERASTAALKFLLPGSVPDLATMGIMAVPGAGIPAALARTAAAGAAGAGISALQGGDPAIEGIEQAAASLGGHVLGASGRFAARHTKAALDKAPAAIAKVIGSLVPEFKGKTAEEVFANLRGGRSLQALSEAFGRVRQSLFDAHGDPRLRVEAMAEDMPRTGVGVEGAHPASAYLRKITSMRESLFRDTGQRKDLKDISAEVGRLSNAERQVEEALARAWPREAVEAYHALKGRYQTGSEISRLFHGGREFLGKGESRELFPAEGRVDLSELQRLYLERAGVLDQIAPGLRQALFRGETNPLRRDVPAVYPGVSWYPPAHLSVHAIPRAPKLAGEGRGPDVVADAVRGLSTRGLQQVADDLGVGRRRR